MHHRAQTLRETLTAKSDFKVAMRFKRGHLEKSRHCLPANENEWSVVNRKPIKIKTSFSPAKTLSEYIPGPDTNLAVSIS